jgi:hypothetical protein
MTRLGGHPLREASNSSFDPNLNSIGLDFDAMEGSWNREGAETEGFTWSKWSSVDGGIASGIIRRESIQVGGLDSRRYNETHQEPGRQR